MQPGVGGGCVGEGRQGSPWVRDTLGTPEPGKGSLSASQTLPLPKITALVLQIFPVLSLRGVRIVTNPQNQPEKPQKPLNSSGVNPFLLNPDPLLLLPQMMQTETQCFSYSCHFLGKKNPRNFSPLDRNISFMWQRFHWQLISWIFRVNWLQCQFILDYWWGNYY